MMKGIKVKWKHNPEGLRAKRFHMDFFAIFTVYGDYISELCRKLTTV